MCSNTTGQVFFCLETLASAAESTLASAAESAADAASEAARVNGGFESKPSSRRVMATGNLFLPHSLSSVKKSRRKVSVPEYIQIMERARREGWNVFCDDNGICHPEEQIVYGCRCIECERKRSVALRLRNALAKHHKRTLNKIP